jgi:glycosyltransferase involved in cell wall biosynthesis
VTPLRIALLNPCFWPEVQRGAERILRELATDLIAAGHRPRLITSHPGRPSRSVEDGLPIVRHWRPPEAPLLHRGAQEYMTHLPFTRLSLDRGDDDLAHAFYPTDAVVARRWGVRTGRPSVFTYGGIPQRDVIAARRWRVEFLEEAIGGCDAVVAYSRAAADALRRWFGAHAHVIYPAVRLDLFEVTRGRAERPTVVCAAPADDARKRVGLLVRAMARVRRSRPGARLVLMRPRDPDLARQLEADGAELFDPHPVEVVRHYQQAWTTVLPSYNEAFGLVMVESLACGTPAVGTRDGGITEILDGRPEVGRLFEGEAEELAQAILESFELASDPATPAACRDRAEAFSTDVAAARYEELYRALLADAGSSGRTGWAGAPASTQASG